MKKLLRENAKAVKELWPNITGPQLKHLQEISNKLMFSVRSQDVLLLNGSWYVTHAGLLKLAMRKQCRAIITELSEPFWKPEKNRWVFKATVVTSQQTTFVGYGDADPSNVSYVVQGAEMRVAETRAVNRALRKAYGIGLCSAEEIGSFGSSPQPVKPPKKTAQPVNGNAGGQTRLRDRLCQLIRQHQLDPVLVKSYALE